MNIYDYIVKDRNGNDVALSIYKGKVLLIVNTATGCGLTPQYNEIQKLYERYRNEGLEILDFPCNQFKDQAPGSNEEIHEFCVRQFQTTFRQFGKIDVNGRNEDPLYTYLKKQKGGVLGKKIKWNFTKFLVDAEGNVVARFAPTSTPMGDEIQGELKHVLAKGVNNGTK